MNGWIVPEVLEAAGLDANNPITEIAVGRAATRDLYLWIAMQVIALAKFGMIGGDDEQAWAFIRNMLVRGPLRARL